MADSGKKKKTKFVPIEISYDGDEPLPLMVQIKEGGFERKRALPPYLENEDERFVIDWIKELSDQNTPVYKDDVLRCIKSVLYTRMDKSNTYDDALGAEWWNSFLEEHPTLKVKKSGQVVVSEDVSMEEASEDGSYTPDSSDEMANQDDDSSHAPSLGPKKHKQYSKVQLKTAFDAVRNKKMSIGKAAKLYNVPRTTLYEKVTGRTSVDWHVKPPSLPYDDGNATCFTEEEEKKIVNWVISEIKKGVPPNKSKIQASLRQLFLSDKRDVAEIVMKLKNLQPGAIWWKDFLERHIDYTLKEVNDSIDNGLEDNKWSINLVSILKEKNGLQVMTDSSRVFCLEEINFLINPKDGSFEKVKVRKNPREVTPGPHKLAVTYIGSFSANGTITTPTLIYPLAKIPDEIKSEVPGDFYVTKSISGWSNSEVFYDYISQVFYPWLIKMKIQFPVVIFIDGNATSIIMQAFHFCEQNGIIIYSFPDAKDHILEPKDDDECVFYHFKSLWEPIVKNFLDGPVGEINKKDLPGLLKLVLDNLNNKSISNWFEKSEIYPFDVEKFIEEESKESLQMNVSLEYDSDKSFTAEQEGERGIFSDQEEMKDFGQSSEMIPQDFVKTTEENNEEDIDRNDYWNAIKVIKNVIGDEEFRKCETTGQCSWSLHDLIGNIKRKIMNSDKEAEGDGSSFVDVKNIKVENFDYL